MSQVRKSYIFHNGIYSEYFTGLHKNIRKSICDVHCTIKSVNLQFGINKEKLYLVYLIIYMVCHEKHSIPFHSVPLFVLLLILQKSIKDLFCIKYVSPL